MRQTRFLMGTAMIHDDDLKLDMVKTLSVFNYILDKGEKISAGHYAYSGLQAKHDHDGYRLTLFDADVELTLLFHNKYQANFSRRTQFDAFLHKIDRIYYKQQN